MRVNQLNEIQEKFLRRVHPIIKAEADNEYQINNDRIRDSIFFADMIDKILILKQYTNDEKMYLEYITKKYKEWK